VPASFGRALAGSAACAALQQAFHSELNSDQQRAVAAALSARDYCCLLGMPGTGKTATLVFLLRCYVALGRSVLVSSHTHSAVDNVLIKCARSGAEVLRVGRASAVSPELHSATLECIIEEGLPSLSALHERLAHAQVVGVTCLGIRHALFAKRSFDVCIVDEASQIPEPVALGPLRTARLFLLVGDHMQLPPLVLSPEAKKGGMEVSLFKRLSEAYPEAVFSCE
jgi:DNA replication ATP-dependent helicase Dna2